MSAASYQRERVRKLCVADRKDSSSIKATKKKFIENVDTLLKDSSTTDIAMLLDPSTKDVCQFSKQAAEELLWLEWQELEKYHPSGEESESVDTEESHR